MTRTVLTLAVLLVAFVLVAAAGLTILAMLHHVASTIEALP